jgi:hypothetical protein
VILCPPLRPGGSTEGRYFANLRSQTWANLRFLLVLCLALRTPLWGPLCFAPSGASQTFAPLRPGLPLSLLRKPGQARSADVAKTEGQVRPKGADRVANLGPGQVCPGPEGAQTDDLCSQSPLRPGGSTEGLVNKPLFHNPLLTPLGRSLRSHLVLLFLRFAPCSHATHLC